jgi:glycine/D-amino acid oxidase-like deaminating enzyme
MSQDLTRPRIPTEKTRQAVYSRLENSINVDTAIVGGGLAAFAAALKLHKSGNRVAVIVPGRIGEGLVQFPQNSFAVVDCPSSSRWYEALGLNLASKLAAEHRDAVIELQKISSAFDGTHFTPADGFLLAESEEGLGAIERECAVDRALRGDAWFTRETPLAFPTTGALKSKQLGKLHLAPMLRAMASELQMLGGEVYENSPPIAHPRWTPDCEITTEHGKVHAAKVILATRTPHSLLSAVTGKMIAQHSYLILTRLHEQLDEAVYFMEDAARHAFWCADRNNPSKVIFRSTYIGKQPGSQALMLDELGCFASKRFTVKGAESRWSEHSLIAPDGLPVAGAVPESENVFIVSGLDAFELPWGISCGNMLAEMVQGRRTSLSELFDPNRLEAREEYHKGGARQATWSSSAHSKLVSESPFSEIASWRFPRRVSA